MARLPRNLHEGRRCGGSDLVAVGAVVVECGGEGEGGEDWVELLAFKKAVNLFLGRAAAGEAEDDDDDGLGLFFKKSPTLLFRRCGLGGEIGSGSGTGVAIPKVVNAAVLLGSFITSVMLVRRPPLRRFLLAALAAVAVVATNSAGFRGATIPKSKSAPLLAGSPRI